MSCARTRVSLDPELNRYIRSRPPVPADRFAFRLPKQCPNCGPVARANIRIGQTIKGELVHIWWRCGMCEVKWPIHPNEQGERRSGERRLLTRKRVPPKDRRGA